MRFDHELQPDDNDWLNSGRIHFKNANTLLNLDHATWNISPTIFQKSSRPERFHHRFSDSDGISNRARPAKNLKKLAFDIDDGPTITKADRLITFVNRHIEPYRGYSFIRSIPLIQELQPEARIVIVGEREGVSYGKA